MCTTSCGSGLWEQTKPKAFLASSCFSTPQHCTQASFQLFGTYVNISAGAHWSPGDAAWLQHGQVMPMGSKNSPSPCCHSSLGWDRRDLAGTGHQLHQLPFGERAAVGLVLLRQFYGFVLVLCLCGFCLSAPNGLLTCGSRSEADNCFPSLINRYKMSAQGACFQLIAVHLMPDVGYLLYQGDL